MDIEAEKGEAIVFAASLVQQVNREDVANMVQVQRGMLQRFEKTNEMLINFNQLSYSRYEASVTDFQQHTQLLFDMKKDLDSIFKRIRTLKQRLSKAYPDAFAACSSVIMMEEEEGGEEEEKPTNTTSKSSAGSSESKSSTIPRSSARRPTSVDSSRSLQKIAQPQKPRSKSAVFKKEERVSTRPERKGSSGHVSGPQTESGHSLCTSAGGHTKPKPL